MELIRWNPMREMLGMHPRMNTLFDDFFAPSSLNAHSNEASLWNWNPVVDIYDEEDSIVIKAELPGVDKDDIVVDVKGRVLTLKGERSGGNETGEDNYYRRESCYGKFERVFTLPVNVNSDNIKADYKDGVLKIAVPRPEAKKPRQITIH